MKNIYEIWKRKNTEFFILKVTAYRNVYSLLSSNCYDAERDVSVQFG